MKSLLYIIAILSFPFNKCMGQTIDTFTQFANVNQELFWNIISRNYPFTHEEIQYYKEDINFYYLSANENISWTSDLIKKYESLLSKTYLLQRNKGVNWNELLINEFLDREWLDWSELYFNRKLTISKKLYEREKRNFITTKFIIDESIDSISFYYHHEYYTKKRVFKNYLRNWYKDADSTLINNYDKLKPYLGKSISEVPTDTIIKYKKDIRWHDYTEFAELSWSWKDLIRLFPYLEDRYIPDNKLLYNKLFKPVIDSSRLLKLHKQFQKRSLLYELRSAEDEYGSLPGIRVLKKGYPYQVELSEEWNFQRSFPKRLSYYRFEVGHSAEGPKRFSDIMFLDRDYWFSAFVCSQKVKYVLENHNLPHHKFYPVELALDSYWYGSDTSKYYLFVCNNSSLMKCIQAESTKIKDSRDLLSEYYSIDIDSLKISSLAQFQNYIDPVYHYENYSYKHLANMELDGYFDLLTIDGSKIYFSKRLRDALIRAKTSGAAFIKDYSINWSFSIPEHQDTSVVITDSFMDYVSKNQQKRRAKIEKAKQRKIHLSKNWNNVSKIYKNLNKKTLDSLELKLIELETAWDVLFPQEYRKYLLTNQKPKLGWLFREYEFLPIDRIEQIGKEWHQSIPQTYKGVLIAENGVGDYLGFLLESESDYKLSNTIYLFEHEMGEVIEAVKLE